MKPELREEIEKVVKYLKYPTTSARAYVSFIKGFQYSFKLQKHEVINALKLALYNDGVINESAEMIWYNIDVANQIVYFFRADVEEKHEPIDLYRKRDIFQEE